MVQILNIDQNQEVVHIATPFDDELVQLGQKLNETYIAYGYEGNELKKRQAEQDENAGSVAPSVLVERTVTKSGKQYKNESWDLVDAENEGVEIENIPKDQLPEEMQNMTTEEQKKRTWIKKQRNERSIRTRSANLINREEII